MKTQVLMKALAATMLAAMVMAASSEAAMSQRVSAPERASQAVGASISSPRTTVSEPRTGLNDPILYVSETGGRRDLSSGQRYSLLDWTLAMLTAPLR